MFSGIFHNSPELKTTQMGLAEADEMDNKTWFTHTMEFYSAIKATGTDTKATCENLKMYAK